MTIDLQLNRYVQGMTDSRGRTRTILPKGAVIWMTGLSGAGKSTLAYSLNARLSLDGTHSLVIDGDVLRRGLCIDLGFSDADRRESIRRAGEVSMLVAETGTIVIAALISPFASARKLVAERCRSCEILFAEVFVSTSKSECERRDPKGLYARARAGGIRQFTGVDSPYEPPTHPDLEINTEGRDLAQCVDAMYELVLRIARPNSTQP